jgi:organic radical activating enzyme
MDQQPDAQLSTLEFCITDFCNLDCPLCGQGTPLHKDKRTMTVEQIEYFSGLLRDGEFQVIKISGGEPTLHKEFAWISRNLRRMFPGRHLYLATNGALATNYLADLKLYDTVDVSNYPGLNDSQYARFTAAYNDSNLLAQKKTDYADMIDVWKVPNWDKKDIYKTCSYREIKKVVQDRIYPCCVVFGQSQRQGFDPETVSVPFDANWRERLARVDIEDRCRLCFADVPAPRVSRIVLLWRRLLLLRDRRWLEQARRRGSGRGESPKSLVSQIAPAK